MTDPAPGSHDSTADVSPDAGDPRRSEGEQLLSRPKKGRMRRVRSASESLLAIALGLEAALMFFVALTAFGLRSLPAPVALGGGAAAIVVLVLATGLVRWRAGVWFGWALQAALLATGLVLPVMFGIGALFAGIWIYCFVTGRRLDRQHPTPTEGTP